MQNKIDQYRTLADQIRQFADNTADVLSLFANTAALIHHAFGFWWTGFYRVAGEELILSAFQGPVACTRIGYGKGVCGTAWKERRSIVVRDVEQFEGHIACSSESRSEIVVPLFVRGEVWAVLDIDSDKTDTFDANDQEGLENIAGILARACESICSPVRDIYLAGGCFWGTQHYLSLLRGVLHAEAGYANGHTANPTYKEVYTDATGYAETVHVRYDASVTSLSRILEMFFKTIDPTSLNRQGGDVGTRYRTGVFYTAADDLAVIQQAIRKVASRYNAPVVVEVKPLLSFHLAEEEHQDYLAKHPDGYCHIPWELMEEAAAQR